MGKHTRPRATCCGGTHEGPATQNDVTTPEGHTPNIVLCGACGDIVTLTLVRGA